jgi:hypothetical protein
MPGSLANPARLRLDIDSALATRYMARQPARGENPRTKIGLHLELRPDHHWRPPYADRVLLAVLCLVLVLVGQSVNSAEFERRPPATEPHRCGCDSCSGDDSCCCARVERTTVACPDYERSSEATALGQVEERRPCFRGGPCDRDGLPESPPSHAPTKTAIATGLPWLDPRASTRAYVRRAPILLPSPDCARIDEPPESSTV